MTKLKKIGVERSRAALAAADLVLLVLDASQPLTDEDRELLTTTQAQHRIILLNKQDLPTAFDATTLAPWTEEADVLGTSVVTTAGMDALADRISSMFMGGIANRQADVMVTNARQAGLLRQARQSLRDVISGLDNDMPLDMVQMDLTDAWDHLGEITGDAAPDELITTLFSQFCLGK